MYKLTNQEKKAFIAQVNKPINKPESIFFQEKLDFINQYKTENNIKKITINDHRDIIAQFRVDPSNNIYYQSLEQQYNTAIDSYYEALMNITDNNGLYVFRNNYEFNRFSLSLSYNKRYNYTPIVPTPTTTIPTPVPASKISSLDELQQTRYRILKSLRSITSRNNSALRISNELNKELTDINTKINNFYTQQYTHTFNKKINKGFLLLKLNFTVTGNDHDGYCSDGQSSDADLEENLEFYPLAEGYIYCLLTPDIPVEYDNDKFITSKFTKNILRDYGCTSNGSGYCHGMHQSYNITSIQLCHTLNTPYINNTNNNICFENTYYKRIISLFNNYEIPSSFFNHDDDDY
jgi:hypothetical protein